MKNLKKALESQIVLAPSTWSRILLVGGSTCCLSAAASAVFAVLLLVEMRWAALFGSVLFALFAYFSAGLASYLLLERKKIAPASAQSV